MRNATHALLALIVFGLVACGKTSFDGAASKVRGDGDAEEHQDDGGDGGEGADGAPEDTGHETRSPTAATGGKPAVAVGGDDGAAGPDVAVDGGDASAFWARDARYVVTRPLAQLGATFWGATAECEPGDTVEEGGAQCFGGAISASYAEGAELGRLAKQAWSARCNYATTGVDTGSAQAYVFAICRKTAKSVAALAPYVVTEKMTHGGADYWGASAACKDGDTLLAGGGQCFGGALSAVFAEGVATDGAALDTWSSRCNYATTGNSNGADKAYAFALCVHLPAGAAPLYARVKPLEKLGADFFGASPACDAGHSVVGGGAQCFGGGLSATFVDGAKEATIASDAWTARCNYGTTGVDAGGAKAYAFVLCGK